MTLPDERYRAVRWAEQFLLKLSDSKQTPRIPKELRQEAWSILRHYPSAFDLQQAANACPDVFQREMEPLYRMIKQHEQDKADDNNKDITG